MTFTWNTLKFDSSYAIPTSEDDFLKTVYLEIIYSINFQCSTTIPITIADYLKGAEDAGDFFLTIYATEILQQFSDPIYSRDIDLFFLKTSITIVVNNKDDFVQRIKKCISSENLYQ